MNRCDYELRFIVSIIKSEIVTPMMCHYAVLEAQAEKIHWKVAYVFFDGASWAFASLAMQVPANNKLAESLSSSKVASLVSAEG